MDVTRIARLEQLLKALGNANRLHLLVALQKPRALTELALPPSRSTSWGSDSRSISKQAVRGHLDALMEIGVVTKRGEGGEVRFVVNHARLFEATQELRELATVRADALAEDVTRRLAAVAGAAVADGPHLVLVRGVNEGQVFPLTAPEPEGGWSIGRARDAFVTLDYDPYVSGRHAAVTSRGGRHYLVDERVATNRTQLNWQPLVAGGVAPLKAGDLIGVGMSLLLYRD